MKLTT
jgi:AP2-associated kinase